MRVTRAIPLARRDVRLTTISDDQAVTSVDPVRLTTKKDAMEALRADPVHQAHIRRVWDVELGRCGRHMHSHRATLRMKDGGSTGLSARPAR